MDPEPYLQEMANVPVISAESIPRHRESLRAVVRLAHYLCEAAGLQVDAYRNRKLRYPYQDPQTLPYVVKEAMRYITAHVDESFIVKDIAGHLRCHPDFLSRKFKQHMGIDLSAYLQQTRIDRAKNLLENPKMDIGTAADSHGCAQAAGCGVDGTGAAAAALGAAASAVAFSSQRLPAGV
jgi:AraC-like DNA-binding protein